MPAAWEVVCDLTSRRSAHRQPSLPPRKLALRNWKGVEASLTPGHAASTGSREWDVEEGGRWAKELAFGEGDGE